MPRTAKPVEGILSTVVVVPGTVEYHISAGTVNDGDLKITPVILGKLRNSDAIELPSAVVAGIKSL